MKTRCIYGVAAALALSAVVTLFAQAPAGGAQTPPPAGGGQAPAGGRGAGRGEGAPAGGQGAGAGAAPQRGGGGGRGVNLRPKALDTASDIQYEVVKDFFKLPPNVYMGEGIGIATNSKGHIFVNTCAQQTRNFEFDEKGNFVREIGKDSYGNVFCHGIEGRCPGQHLGDRRGRQLDHQVQPAGTRGHDPRPSPRVPLQRHRAGHTGSRSRSALSFSIVPPTFPSTRKATSSWRTATSIHAS